MAARRRVALGGGLRGARRRGCGPAWSRLDHTPATLSRTRCLARCSLALCFLLPRRRRRRPSSEALTLCPPRARRARPRPTLCPRAARDAGLRRPSAREDGRQRRPSSRAPPLVGDAGRRPPEPPGSSTTLRLGRPWEPATRRPSASAVRRSRPAARHPSALGHPRSASAVGRARSRSRGRRSRRPPVLGHTTRTLALAHKPGAAALRARAVQRWNGARIGGSSSRSTLPRPRRPLAARLARGRSRALSDDAVLVRCSAAAVLAAGSPRARARSSGLGRVLEARRADEADF